MPPGGEPLWTLFLRLHARRRWSDFGMPAAIQISELADWLRLLRIRLTPWEVEAIFALDDAWRLEESRKPPPRPTDEDDD